MINFSELKINEKILYAIEDADYSKPTPIQEVAIPILMSGKDLIGQAQTGTGKTAAFAIPILNKLADIDEDTEIYRRVKTIIMAPTRELAIQIGENFQTYGKYLSVYTGVIFGGVTPKRHIKVLKREPSVLVATPGRLRSFIEDDILDVSQVDTLVLDEADRMLEYGMLEDVEAIINYLPKKRQTIMFSATMASNVETLAKKCCHQPEKVVIESKKSNEPKIEQLVKYIEETHKTENLIDFLNFEDYESIIVFVRTKRKADILAKAVNMSNIRTRALHGDIGQKERIKTLGMFKDKTIKVLIATDVAARGIDVDAVSYVVNFNVPNIPETYIHRIGRTGRAGQKGVALTYCSKAEIGFLKDIESLQKIKLKVV